MSAVSGRDLVASLEGVVGRLRVLFGKHNSRSLTDDLPEVRQLCQELEVILRHQQKEKLSFWGERRDYYHFLSDQVADMKDIESCCKKVNSFPKLTTPQGRGRALVRLCLCDGKLAECVQNAVNNEKLTRDWYCSGAVLRLPSLCSRLLTALYDLGDLTFDLPCDEMDLNDSWPNFQRKRFSSDVSVSPAVPSSKSKSSLSRIQDAHPDIEDRGRESSLQVEHAIEEEPTEIYVKKGITFDIPFAIQVLQQIVQSLQAISPTTLTPHQVTSQVSSLEDLPRGLAVLQECVAAWTGKVEKRVSTLEMSNEGLELQLKMAAAHSEQEEEELVLRVRDLEDALASYKSETKKLKVEMQSLYQEQEDLENTISSQAENIKALQTEVEDLNEHLSTSNSSIEEVFDDIMQFCKGEGESMLGMEVSDWMKQHKESDQDVPEENEEANLLETKLDFVRTCWSHMTWKLVSLTSEKEELQRNLDSTVNVLTRETSPPPPPPEGESGSMYDEMLSTAEGKVEELESQQDILKDEIVGLREILRSKESDLPSVKGTPKDRKPRHKKVDKVRHTSSPSASSSPTTSSTLEVEQLRQEVARLQGEAEEKLQSKEDEVFGLRERLEHSQSELRSLHEMIEQDSSSLRFENSSLVMEREEARKAGSKLKEELEQHKALLKERGSVGEKMKAIQKEMESYQEEARQLQEQLVEMQTLRDQDRIELLELKNHVDSSKEFSESEREDTGRRMARLSKENEEMRKAVAGLLRQKASLYLHASDLEDKAQSTWHDSNIVFQCMRCKEQFSFLIRKHHCRLCGKVFCWKCCSNWVTSTSSSGKVRSCTTCLEEREESVTDKITNDLDEAKKIVTEIPLEGDRDEDWPDSSSIYGSYKIPPPTADSRSLVNGGEYSVVPILDGEAGDGLPFVLHSEYQEAQDGGRGTHGKPEPYCVIESSSSLTDKTSAATTMLKNGGAGARGEGGGTSVEQQSSDDCSLPQEKSDGDEYTDLVSPGSLNVEVLRERLAVLKAHDRKEQGREGEESANNTLTVGSPANSVEEVSLSAGQSHEVQLTVQQSGCTLEWEFRSEPKGIAFGIYYQLSKSTKTRLEVLPQRRCTSHKTVLSGKIVAQKSGVYTMCFDNGFSKYSGCRLFYKVQTDPS